MEDAKNEQLLILSLTLGYIALQQVHGISISKCRLQPVKQVATTGKESAGPVLPPVDADDTVERYHILHGFNSGICA